MNFPALPVNKMLDFDYAKRMSKKLEEPLWDTAHSLNWNIAI